MTPVRQRGKVLLVTSNFPRWPGDSTTPFILHIAQDLIALGWDIRVLAPHAPGARVEEQIEGVPVRRFRYLWPESQQTLCYQGGALANLRRDRTNALRIPPLVMSELLAIARELARGGYDLVHSHWLLPQGFTASIAARLMRVPHVATVHGSDVFALRGGLLSACKRLVIRRSDVVTVNSSATQAAVAQLCPSARNVVRIPIGVSYVEPGRAAGDASVRERFRRGNGPLLIFVGRLVEEKGVDDLLHAVAQCQSTLGDITALIVGDGPARAQLELLARTLGIEQRVSFAGWLEPSQVMQHLRGADIFVGPSRRAANGGVEGQGLVFIEAMMGGTPVVATASGGIVDVVRHEETGLLVAERAPQEIARAIIRLVQEPQLAERLVRNARALVQSEFTREVSARAFSSTFERALGTGQPAGVARA